MCPRFKLLTTLSVGFALSIASILAPGRPSFSPAQNGRAAGKATSERGSKRVGAEKRRSPEVASSARGLALKSELCERIEALQDPKMISVLESLLNNELSRELKLPEFRISRAKVPLPASCKPAGGPSSREILAQARK